MAKHIISDGCNSAAPQALLDSVGSVTAVSHEDFYLRLQDYFDFSEENDGSHIYVYLKPEYQYDRKESWLQVLLRFDAVETDAGEIFDYNEDSFVSKIEESINDLTPYSYKENFLRELLTILDKYLGKPVSDQF